MSGAFNWTNAWETIDEDDEYYGGAKCYTLPNGTTIYPGDRFWRTDDRLIIEVQRVMTKHYRGVVAPKGEEGGDAVFYEPDWEPEPHPARPAHQQVDNIDFITVDSLAEKLDDGDIVPHRGNGLPPLPP